MANWESAPVVSGGDQASGGGWQSAPVVDPATDAGEWERATLLPIEKNRKTGEWRLAVPGFLQAAGEAAALPGDVYTGKTPLDPRLSFRDQNPETLDRAATLAGGLGSELPLAARGMVQPTVRNLVGPNGKAMPKLVADSMVANNVTPATIPMRQAQLGPAAVLGDMSPRLQARTGAVATTPGPGQDMIVEAMLARQKGANPRIKAAINDTFGPEPVPSQVRAEINVARDAANEAYKPVFREKALSDNFLYDAQPLAAALDEQVPNFVGATRAKIQSIRSMLVNPQTGELTTDPQMIMAVRKELDGMIDAEKGPNGNTTTLAALGDMRRMIDEDLGMQVPGVKWADARYADVANQQNAFDLGRESLKAGENPLNPADLAAEIQRMSGPQGTAIGPRTSPSIAPQRLAEGTLSKIYEIIGTKANDRVALKQILAGEGSWNREKLVMQFGEEKTKKLIDLLDAEATLAQTEALAVGGSKTEVLRSGKDGIEPSKTEPGVIRSAINLNVGDALAKAADKVTGGLSKRLRDQRNADIAAALLSRAEDWSPSPSTMSNSPGLAPLSNATLIDAIIKQGKRGGIFKGSGGGGY